MRFLVLYVTLKGMSSDSYWRTVYGDTINEAIYIAKRYARKGYRLSDVTQVY